MENYIVSARKYRPETFQTVVGQPSITTTLKNAIRIKQLAHAYLFCGPRGVGKTTCARIFAKTINCFNITGAIEACNECESCLSFNSSRSYNIHELDAASNNSVEDIRNLIEQVRIPPQVGKYSVYIIDEVHMLSSNAFNAFLKTLEEPPPHAIFILATTEKHKIIPTILSRCQIFDFNRIKIEDIIVHLETIANAEKIEAETEGLNIIAQKADGAMRDALSIFDQIASFTAGKISYQNVIENLNVLDYDYYFKLTEAILANNISSALILFDEVLDKGFDGHNFINGLSRHFRDLLVCRDEVTLSLLEVGAGTREKYKIQAKLCSPDFLINSLSITNQCDLSFRSSKNQRLHVELCLVRLCSQLTAEKKKSEPGLTRKKEGDPSGKSTKIAPSGQADNTQKSPGVSSRKPQKEPEGRAPQETSPEHRQESAPASIPASQQEASPESRREASLEPPEEASHLSQPGYIPGSQQKQSPYSPVEPAGTVRNEPARGDENKQTGVDQNKPDGDLEKESSGVDQNKPAGSYEKEPAGIDEDEPSPDSGNSDGKEAITTASESILSPESNLNPNIYSSNTISIKDALNGTVKFQPKATKDDAGPGKEDETPGVHEAYDEFTEKELTEQWRKFANQIKDRHPRLHNTLLANKPGINSQTSIRFEISNPLQNEALNKIKPELLSHLRRELNGQLQLEICINETLQQNRLYLPEDKYEHMLKKNPVLAKFKQKFNLDFE